MIFFRIIELHFKFYIFTCNLGVFYYLNTTFYYWNFRESSKIFMMFGNKKFELHYELRDLIRLNPISVCKSPIFQTPMPVDGYTRVCNTDH